MIKKWDLMINVLIVKFIFLFLFLGKISADFSYEQKMILYEDCSVFNNTNLYGGEICGSDGITYANTLVLDCINHHNSRDVGTWHRGKCRHRQHHCEPNPVYSPVCGSDNQTWTNHESLFCANEIHSLNLTVKFVGVCEEPDYCSYYGIDAFGINQVCASNGFTYLNVAEVKCLQRKNPELTVLHDGGCKVSIVHKLYGLGSKLCEIADTRYEWNPVCASNNETYTNPFYFLCYESERSVQLNNKCGTVSYEACISAHMNSSRDENGEYVNDDFDSEHEVCGNDGRTYQSSHHIQCQSLHNKYLYTKHSGPCSGPDDNPCAAIPEENGRFPVCGTDGVTYVSPEAIWCAKRRSPEKQVAYLHDGPC